MKIVLSVFTFLALTLGNTFANEVNVFTSRHYDSDVNLYKKFTEKTGIKVNVVTGLLNDFRVTTTFYLSRNSSSFWDHLHQIYHLRL